MKNIFLILTIIIVSHSHSQTKEAKFEAIKNMINDSPLCRLAAGNNYNSFISDIDVETYRFMITERSGVSRTEFVLDMLNIEDVQKTSIGLTDESKRPWYLRKSGIGCDYMVVITLKNEVRTKVFKEKDNQVVFTGYNNRKQFYLFLEKEFDMDRFIRYSTDF